MPGTASQEFGERFRWAIWDPYPHDLRVALEAARAA